MVVRAEAVPPDRDAPAMTHIGRRVAGGLLARRPGCSVGFDGWSAALQLAADLTLDHREVLRIADEIHATAELLTTRAMIRFYARSATSTVDSASVRALLDGMVLEAEDRDDRELRPAVTDAEGTGERDDS